MFCHGAGLRPGRLQGIAASFSVCGPDTPLPEERDPRAHNARPAARPRPRARSGGAHSTWMSCCVMFCHVPLPWRPFLHCVSFPPRSRPPVRGADPVLPALRARLRPGPRARRAQGALRPCVSPGFFRAGAKRKAAAPRMPPPSSLIVACFLSSQILVGNYFRFTEQIVSLDRHTLLLLRHARTCSGHPFPPQRWLRGRCPEQVRA